MPLSNGARLGPYEIVGALGAGGMGEVYKARDTRLDRIVAIKILPPTLAGDPEFRERFDREARTISRLTHPNICTLYDVGENFLVMEYLEGETLAARLQTGALPVDDALTIAIEIADALNTAHRAGIVHRDLKPGNVMLTKGGAKLLDFGLAKAGVTHGFGAAAPSGATLSAPPTMTTPPNITAQGAILGTFQYMAPEQLEGAEADARSDIFAFGCVLYEMLAGRKAFHGRTQVSLIGAILKDNPPSLATAQPAVPPALTWLVNKCLAKDPDRRWQTASDLVSQLEWIAEGGGAAERSVDLKPARSSWRGRLLVAGAALVLAALTGAGVWFLRPAPAAPQPARFSVVPPGDPISIGSPHADIAISPDGTHVVYLTGGGGTGALWVRRLDQLEAVQLRGLPSSSLSGPSISPDSKWIAFGSADVLRKVSITGGPPISLTQGSGAGGTMRGISWGPDDIIIFATTDSTSGLLSLPAGGGDAKVLTKPDPTKSEGDHWFPFVLPGGRAVLFTITTPSGLDNAQVAALDLASGEQKILIRGGSQAAYVESGHLIYAAAGALRAVRFDPVRLEVLSDPVPVVDQVATKFTGAADFSVSANGTLVYVPGGVGTVIGGVARSLVWVTRQGVEEPIKGLPPRAYLMARLSPDGSRIALDVRDQQNDI
jgi:serine/threonine-protein kinase